MILDVTCGLREMWFEKEDSETVYLDWRQESISFYNDVRGKIQPTVQADNRCLPFCDNVFDMVIFDPPHLIEDPAKVHVRDGSLYQKMYDTLHPLTWIKDVYRASREAFRVLKVGGFLVFKWADHDRPVKRLMALFPERPLFGTRSHSTKRGNSTYWIVFRKNGSELKPTQE